MQHEIIRKQTEEKFDRKTLGIMAAIIASKGIESRIAIDEAFRILETVNLKVDERFQLKLSEENSRRRGWNS